MEIGRDFVEIGEYRSLLAQKLRSQVIVNLFARGHVRYCGEILIGIGLEGKSASLAKPTWRSVDDCFLVIGLQSTARCQEVGSAGKSTNPFT